MTVPEPEPVVMEEPVAAEEPIAAPVLSYQPEEEVAAIPVYLPDMPLPVSALDGYELDEQEVLNAITQVDTQSVEQEAQVLEAMEVISAPPAFHKADEDVLEDSDPSPMAQPQPGQSGIKRGFF